MLASVAVNQPCATHLSETGLGCSACGDRQLGLQVPNPDVSPCVPHYDMLVLAVTAHAVHAVQPVHSCSDGTQQCRAASHLPHTHTTVACGSAKCVCCASQCCRPPLPVHCINCRKQATVSSGSNSLIPTAPWVACPPAFAAFCPPPPPPSNPQRPPSMNTSFGPVVDRALVLSPNPSPSPTNA